MKHIKKSSKVMLALVAFSSFKSQHCTGPKVVVVWNKFSDIAVVYSPDDDIGRAPWLLKKSACPQQSDIRGEEIF